MSEPMYYLFRKGFFVGKYTREQWRAVHADETFHSYVYLSASKVWYYSAWGSFVPLNGSDLPNEIKALLLLTPIESL